MHDILHAPGLREVPHFEGAPDPYEIDMTMGWLASRPDRGWPSACWLEPLLAP
jgi:hypothetical protein